MDSIERLTRIFERFPGIGPRQAGRFVAYLLRSSPALRRELAEAIRDLGGAVRSCTVCYRFFAGEQPVCGLCANPRRDDTMLAVVATDADLEALERSGTFSGRYFVLGGTISLASESASNLRLKELLVHIKGFVNPYIEIILAFPANPEGDATAARVRRELIDSFPDVKVTSLGRGLSTGSELEYADPDTLRSALDNRK